MLLDSVVAVAVMRTCPQGLAHGVAYQRDILTTYLCSIAFFNSQKPTYFVVCS